MSEPLRPDILAKLGKPLLVLRPAPRPPEPLKLPDTRSCAHCGLAFVPLRANHRYHSKQCWWLAHPYPKGDRHKPHDVKAERTLAVEAVCGVWPVMPDDIIRQGRRRPVVIPRHAAFALVKELRSEASFPDMGRAFKRDHATIINGLKRHALRMAEPDYASKFEAARLLIRSAIP